MENNQSVPKEGSNPTTERFTLYAHEIVAGAQRKLSESGKNLKELKLKK